jgi:chorismate mutase
MTYEEHLTALDTNTVTSESQRFASYADIARISHETGRAIERNAAHNVVLALYHQARAKAEAETDHLNRLMLNGVVQGLIDALIALSGPVDR